MACVHFLPRGSDYVTTVMSGVTTLSLVIMRDYCTNRGTNTCFIMVVCSNRLFTIKFYNTNTCIVRLTNCVSVALNPFNTKRQAMRQQPLKDHSLFWCAYLVVM